MLGGVLGGGREVLLDPVLADGFAERAVGERGAALPARLLLFLPPSVIEEVEVRVLKLLAEQRRSAVHGVPAKIALDGWKVLVGDPCVRRLEVGKAGDD